MAVMMIKQA